mmetsp:Transcript_51280/g.158903  ORF Transcript_51280/g.158903 Transcript_51280/m.158903 type:complete len:252 (+) Transcript_51280:1043-1798(+)
MLGARNREGVPVKQGRKPRRRTEVCAEVREREVHPLAGAVLEALRPLEHEPHVRGLDHAALRPVHHVGRLALAHHDLRRVLGRGADADLPVVEVQAPAEEPDPENLDADVEGEQEDPEETDGVADVGDLPPRDPQQLRQLVRARPEATKLGPNLREQEVPELRGELQHQHQEDQRPEGHGERHELRGAGTRDGYDGARTRHGDHAHLGQPSPYEVEHELQGGGLFHLLLCPGGTRPCGCSLSPLHVSPRPR